MINDLHIKILGKKITKRMLLHSSTKDSIVSSLMSMFNIEYTEAVILMVIFQDSVKNNNEFSTFEFKNTFKISDIEYFSVLPALKNLHTLGLCTVNKRKYENTSNIYPSFSISEDTTEILLSGKNIYEKINKSDPNAWIDHFHKIHKQREDSEITFDTYIKLLKLAVSNMNDSIALKKSMLTFSDIELAIFLYSLSYFAIKKHGGFVCDFVRDILDNNVSSSIVEGVYQSSYEIFTQGFAYLSSKRNIIDDVNFQVFPTLKTLQLYYGEQYYNLKFKKVDFTNIYSIFEYFDELYNKMAYAQLSTPSYIDELTSLASQIDNKLPLSRYCKKLDDDEKHILFTCINKYIKENDSATIYEILERVYDSLPTIKTLHKKIEKNTLRILKDNVVDKEMERNFFNSNLKLTVTPKAIRNLLNIEPIITTDEKSFIHLIKTDSRVNHLYFTNSLKDEIDTLTSALHDQRYKALTNKLHDSGFSKGFVCLFYGAPGTGKTAVCKEIANATKRQILQVDISNIRDMYVGESEKRVKKVFKEYYSMKEQMKSTPILLFNEADALIGKRTDVQRSVDQMNNSMQNILLEELENFDGIFFATTNLIDNLDDAFSRRFMYKVNFKKPDIETRKQIWKKYMPDISDEMLMKIAVKELSGGQIENIAKKYHVETAIRDGKNSNLHDIISNELDFKKANSAIGFNL